MESINITRLVMSNLSNICIPGPAREYVTEFFVTKDLKAILGKHIVLSRDAQISTHINENESIQLYINSIFYSPILISIIKNEQHVDIIADSKGEQIFKIGIKNEMVSNDVSFEEGLESVNEHQEVAIENGDAKRFSLSRKEDGELVYSGSLLPISSSGKSSDYFSFVPSKGENIDPRMILRNLCASSIVEVQTSMKVHQLSEFVSQIYNSLTKKLETTRVKKDVKVKKRLMMDSKPH